MQTVPISVFLAQQKLEHAKVSSCTDHNFYQTFDQQGKLKSLYKCLRCDVEISSDAHRWYAIGYQQGLASK